MCIFYLKADMTINAQAASIQNNVQHFSIVHAFLWNFSILKLGNPRNKQIHLIRQNISPLTYYARFHNLLNLLI